MDLRSIAMLPQLASEVMVLADIAGVACSNWSCDVTLFRPQLFRYMLLNDLVKLPVSQFTVDTCAQVHVFCDRENQAFISI